jgi:hypothetical protein
VHRGAAVFATNTGGLGTAPVGGVQGALHDGVSGVVYFRCSNAFIVCLEGCTRSVDVQDSDAVWYAYALVACTWR